MINLNNGGCSPTPTHVLEQMIRDLRFSNELPVEHMWRVLEPRIESVRRDLAHEFGCDPEEMAITRNASEANEIDDLRARPEARATRSSSPTQNYRRMLNAWDQRERRDGIVLKQVTFKMPPPSDSSTSSTSSSQAITPRTKVIEVTHITNLDRPDHAGAARSSSWRAPRGIEVFVDGAHAFAHFPFTRDELGCDYYGTSLHKWLLAPIGTGFLYVRKDKIKTLWPLMAAPARAGRQHPEVRGDRHAPGRESQRDRRGARVPPRHRRRAQDRAAALPARPLGQAARGRERDA